MLREESSESTPDGNTLQNGFDVAVALLQLRRSCRPVRAAMPQCSLRLDSRSPAMLVERFDQLPNLTARLHIDAIVKAPTRDLVRRFGQRNQRTRHHLREIQRQPGRSEENADGQQQEKPR